MGKGNYLPLFFLALMGLLFPSGGEALATSCERATRLNNRAICVQDLMERERLLTNALGLGCRDKKIVAKIRNNLADTYENQGRLEKAIAEYHKASEADPFLPTPYLSLGDIYTKLKRPKDAARFYEKGFLLQNYKPSEQIVESLSPERSIGIVRVKPKIGLYFGFDQAVLGDDAARQLEALLSALKDPELQPYRFRLEGHTCSLGTKAYNQALSERRAKAVKEWLVALGVAEDRLMAVGFGEDRPVADNTSEEGRRRNRRVEIRTVGVAALGTSRGASGPGHFEAIRLLRQGERLLADERYEEAVELFIRAKKAFEREKFVEGVEAALRDLTLAYRFLGHWEKAEGCRKQVQ